MKTKGIIVLSAASLLLGSCSTGFRFGSKYNLRLNKADYKEVEYAAKPNERTESSKKPLHVSAALPAELTAPLKVTTPINDQQGVAQIQEPAHTIQNPERPAVPIHTDPVQSQHVSLNSSITVPSVHSMEQAFITSLEEFGKDSGGMDDSTLLLVILAILLPPLAVGIYEGITTRFWISLILTLLFFFPGIVYAILVVTGTI